MVSREDQGVDGVSDDPSRGLPKAPAVCLRRTAEVTPTAVRICAAGDPRNWRRLQTGGDDAEGDLRSGVV